MEMFFHSYHSKLENMSKRFYHFSSFWATLLGTVNIGLFCFVLRIIYSDHFVNNANYGLDAISIQFSIMNIMLICVSIFLVVAGVVGYGGLKSHAEEIAKKTAHEVAKSEMIEFLAKQSQDERTYSQTSSIQEHTINNETLKRFKPETAL